MTHVTLTASYPSQIVRPMTNHPHRKTPLLIHVQINAVTTRAGGSTFDAAVWYHHASDPKGRPARDQFRVQGESWQQTVSVLESWLGALAAEHGLTQLEHDYMGWVQQELEFDRPPF